MSDRVGLKAKDNVAKKFSSLNLNQTYKGTKVEAKATAGIPRHGLQSLGKVAASRRMPPPANLPSLKSENLGNDPTVALVPSGGGGWGSGKEREANTTTPTTTNPTQSTAQGTNTDSQQPAQQQSKPTEASQKPASTTGQQTSTGQNTTNQTSGTSTKTWASSSSVAGGPEKTSYPHQSQYFNREFPTLGGGNLGDRQQEERDSHPPYGQPPRNMHDPPWMDKGGTGPPPRPPFGMYNGAPHQGPPQRGGYEMQAHHRDGYPASNYSRPEGSGTFPYMGQSRPSNYPGHPANSRGSPGPRHGGSGGRHMIKMEDSPSGYVRPSILKEDDIRAMDDEDMDEGGWAGAQEEIDYSVKLNFDDDEPPSPVGEGNRKNERMEEKNVSRREEEKTIYPDENQAREANRRPPVPRQAWSGPSHGEGHPNLQQWHESERQGPYHSQRAWSGGYHAQQRTSFPGPPPPGGPPAGGMHLQDGRRMEHRGPEGHDRSRFREQQRSAIEQARQRKEEEELERRRQQEAAAQEKLKMLDAAKNKQPSIQTHDNSVRDQTGPEELDQSRSKEQLRISIEQARQRKEEEDFNKRRQQEAGPQEKLKELDAAKIRQPSIQTHENFTRDQAGPRSPVSPAGSETQVRRIMRRKDSGSTGEDDASVKSVENVGKPEKSDSRKNEYQANDSHERLRKSSSSDLQEGKSSRLKGIKEEQKASESPRPPKEKPEERTSMDKDIRRRNTSIEKEPQLKSGKQTRQGTDVESRHRKPGEESMDQKSKHESKEQEVAQTDRRDSKRRTDELERRKDGSDRKSNEGLRRREESSRKKDQIDSKKETSERHKDEFENRKANQDKRSDYIESRSDRGSRESLRSKDGLDRRKDDRKRGEDTIKRKRDDFEGSESLNERGNRERVQNKDRFYSSRSRPHLGGKSSLRGHPKSYSHSRTDRSGTQRRRNSQRTRTDSREFADDDVSRDVPAEEKRKANEKGEEIRQPEVDRHRREQLSDTRLPGDKRAERQSRDDKPYRGSGRFPQRTTQERPAGRGADKGRDKAAKVRTTGGFGVPAPKQPEPSKGDSQKNKNEESLKTNNEPLGSGEAKYVVSAALTDPSKAEEKEPKTTKRAQNVERSKVDHHTKTDQRKNDERSHFAPPVSNAWGKGELKDMSKAVKSDVDERQTSERHVSAYETKEGERSAPMSSAKDIRRERRISGKNGVDRQSSMKRDTAGERERIDSRNDRRPSSSKDSKSGEQDTKAGERTALQTAGRREQESKSSRGYSRGEFRGSKPEEKLGWTEAPGENRRKQESKFDERRDRTGARDDLRRERDSKTDERRSRVEPRGESRREHESKSDERRDRNILHDNSRRDQGHMDDEEPRSGVEPRGESQQEQESKSDARRDRTEMRDDLRRVQESRTDDRRDHTERQRESHRQQESKVAERRDRVEPPSESRREQQSKAEERGEQMDRGVSQGGFAIGSWSEKQAMDRGRYGESRRGTRRGGRASRGSRGRGRGRVYGSGRIPAQSSTASKDDEDDDDSEDSTNYHSANSCIDGDSDVSDAKECSKQDDAHKDGRSGRSQPTGRGTRQPFGATRPRGRGRGSSPMSSRPVRKLAERPPRFQKQEQSKGASRGRGKSGHGQQTQLSIPLKENWDDNEDSCKNHEKRNKGLEEGPLTKKRPPGNLQDYSLSAERSAGVFKSKKSTRSGQSNKKSSFLAKKQQEVVEGSWKGGSRSSAGPKSTFPAALTHGRNERRGKNDSAPDLDDIPEPPKKNPRRAEPQKMGIDHIDLSNIASFIDIDDIVQPANETEPASPQSGFVEVKSKRTQKELRERAREEEERKRRETEKMMADALLKPKAHKSSNLNKSHQTSKPPRFARSNAANGQVSSVARVNTPPGTVPPTVVTPENCIVSSIPIGSGEQKRTSPLMVEKPASPPPPPMFNAWTKPLSITPAKPQIVPVETSTAMRPDPLAVGSGKPTRPSGTQPKAEEPELQIQVTLPDTFMAMPTERNIEAQTTGNSNGLVEDSEVKKRGVDTEVSQNRKTDGKNAARTTEPTLNNGKNSSGNEKRHISSKFSRPPRFEKGTSVKRNVDVRKSKGGVKEQSSETKPQSSNGDTEKVSKEQNDNILSSGSPSADLNSDEKQKSQVKTTKSTTTDDADRQSEERNPQEKVQNRGGLKNLNKRDSAELDVHSMSESLLDETPLGVRMVETSESASGTPVMDKLRTEDDIQKEYEMEEKMVAAKKAWDDSVSSSASITVKSQKWTKSSVPEADNTESNEGSVMEQLTRPASEVKESPEPLASGPSSRLKKATNGEHQNVCKVKPQQQQAPVKPQQVPSDSPEEFPTSSSMPRPRMDTQPQTNYPVAPTTVFSSKITPQYALSFEQQTMLPFTQYVPPSNIAAVQHASPVRPQAVHPTSQSPPQHPSNFPQGQPVSTPSPLSHQTVLQDSYRPLMQGTLYSTTGYTNNQYFSIPVVRQTTPPQSYQAPANDEVSNSVYTIQASKTQTPGHGYEQAVAAGQPVFLPLDQQYLSHTQSQRQPTVGFYQDNPNQASVTPVPGNISHIQATVPYPQTDKHMQQHGRDSHTNHDQQVYSTSGQSEMVKHVNAKPFQPPANAPSANVAHQLVTPNHHMTAIRGQTSVSPGYHVNNVTIQASSSSSVHSGTSSVVAQTHSIPVSRLSFNPYPGTVGTYQRQVQVPVQSLAQPPYPASLTYRTPVASYPSSNVGNQTGMIVQKPFPVVRQLVTTGRGSPIPPRMPEPIQRPTKPGMLSGNPKEKLANQPPRPKSAHSSFPRRNFNPIRGTPSQIIPYQLQAPPRQQQQQQQQQQQTFRNQQHQLMLSGVQQFFAEDKEIELQHHRKHNQEHQKPELPTTSNDGNQKTNQDKRRQQTKTQPESTSETKPQKSTRKDEHKKPEYKHERRNRQPDRKEVRTAQIPPQRNQTRTQNRSKPGAPKQDPAKTIEQLSAVEPANTEQKSLEKIETRPEIPESQTDVVTTPLVS